MSFSENTFTVELQTLNNDIVMKSTVDKFLTLTVFLS